MASFCSALTLRDFILRTHCVCNNNKKKKIQSLIPVKFWQQIWRTWMQECHLLHKETKTLLSGAGIKNNSWRSERNDHEQIAHDLWTRCVNVRHPNPTGPRDTVRFVFVFRLRTSPQLTDLSRNPDLTASLCLKTCRVALTQSILHKHTHTHAWTDTHAHTASVPERIKHTHTHTHSFTCKDACRCVI